MCIQRVEFFELLGDGDLSVSHPSIFEGFFLHTLNGIETTNHPNWTIQIVTFQSKKNMELVTDQLGNPTTLLIERIFWLGIGGFFGLALMTSLVRGLKQNKIKETNVSAKHLENLAKKAIQKNSNHN